MLASLLLKAILLPIPRVSDRAPVGDSKLICWMRRTARPQACGRAAVVAGLVLGACGGSPVAGPAAMPVPAVSAGFRFACSVTTAGTAHCWGTNLLGQLGIGTTAGPQQCLGQPCSTVPVAVVGGLTLATISAGEGFACGITTTGTTYCWGENVVGELGNGSNAGPETCSGNPCSSGPLAGAGGLTLRGVRAGRHLAW